MRLYQFPIISYRVKRFLKHMGIISQLLILSETSLQNRDNWPDLTVFLNISEWSQHASLSHSLRIYICYKWFLQQMGECAEILSGFMVLLLMNFLFICNLISQKANQPQSICSFTLLHFEVRDPKILFQLTCYDWAYRSLEIKLASQAVVDWPDFGTLSEKYLPYQTQKRSGASETQVRWQQPGIIISSFFVSVKFIEKRIKKRKKSSCFEQCLVMFWYSWWWL